MQNLHGIGVEKRHLCCGPMAAKFGPAVTSLACQGWLHTDSTSTSTVNESLSVGVWSVGICTLEERRRLGGDARLSDGRFPTAREAYTLEVRQEVNTCNDTRLS